MIRYFAVVFLVVFASFAGCKKVVEIQTQTIYVDSTDDNGPEYIITNYGAKGDGKTDCSVIINDLISKLPASGGSIVIPAGDFLLNSPIKINKSFVTIRGVNPGLRSNVDVQLANLLNPGGGSKLIIKNSAVAIEVPVVPDANGQKNRISGVVIKSLLIAGTSSANQTGINILQDNDGFRVDNVIGINLGTGIIANAADAMIINSCWISECKNSIRLNNGIQNMITNCQLGAQPGGITVKFDNQENLNFTGNHVYPDGDINLEMNNCKYNNISSNNFQSYYVGMIEMNGGSNNLLSSNVFWMRLPGDAQRQLRGKENTHGVIRVSGNNNLVSNNTIDCDWANPNNNPVTITSYAGSGNSFQNIKIDDTWSSKPCRIPISS